MDKRNNELEVVLEAYMNSFDEKKIKEDENTEDDLLMQVFNISQDLKSTNKQYWGRELGMCWQLLVSKVFELYHDDWNPPVKFGDDEPADLYVGKDAIDTKYRVGSGDSGTLKKFKQYGELLKNKGYNPVFLFLRTDNLPAAMTACNKGGWIVYTGEDSFQYILDKTGFNLKSWLQEQVENKKFIIDERK